MAEFGYLFRLSYRYWAKILPYACPYLWEVTCHLEIRDIFMPLQKKTRKPYLQLDLGVFYKLAQS